MTRAERQGLFGSAGSEQSSGGVARQRRLARLLPTGVLVNGDAQYQSPAARWASPFERLAHGTDERPVRYFLEGGVFREG